MKKRYFHALLLLLLAMMLPSKMWADSQPYVKLAVADGATSISVSNSLSLTFCYGTKGTNSDTEKYFDLNEGSNAPGWLGTYSGGVFAYASKVTTATFDSSFAAASPTSTIYWFYTCSNLTGINGISNLNTASVTNMSSMFSGCSNLTSLDLSNFNTASVKDMSYMFRDCSSLTSLNLSNWDTSSVTTMRTMFTRCSNLTSLDLSSFRTAEVTNMNNMFKENVNLEHIYMDILYPWNTDKVGESDNMFTGCTNLPNFKSSNITKDYIDTYITKAFTYSDNVDMSDKLEQLKTKLGVSDLKDGTIPAVILDRNMSTTTYGTICLPVSLDADQVTSTFGSGTVVKKLTGATFDSSSNILYFTFTEESSIEAGKPYLIKSTNATPATITSISISTAEGSSITVKDSQTKLDICTM